MLVISQKLFALKPRKKTNLMTKQNENVNTLNFQMFNHFQQFVILGLKIIIYRRFKVTVNLLYVKTFEIDL